MYLVIGVLPTKKRARRYGAPRQLLRKRDLLVSFEPGGSIRAKLSGASSRVPQMDSVSLPSGFDPRQNSSYKGDDVQLELDRSAKMPLAEQIRKGIGVAIESGVLAPGARLPSWQDLAAQLGVARGLRKAVCSELSSTHRFLASSGAAATLTD